MIQQSTINNRQSPADWGLHGSPDADGGLCPPTQYGAFGDPFHGSLADQILWLNSLRWVAVAVVVVGTLAGTYVFPVLADPRPLYAAAAVLLACNFAYVMAAGRGCRSGQRSTLALAMVQMEVDLLVLTAVLHFSGGVANPFCLFYVFHVILATIILPRNLSFAVGLTAIALFGLLAVNELNAGTILGHYPLQLSAGGGIWRNPIYGLAAYVAFACTVMIAQYLTRIVIVRMTSKELEAARNSNLLRAIINARSEGLIFITADGRVSLCNPAAEHWRLDGPGPDRELGNGFPAALAKHIRALADGGPGPQGQDEVIEFTTGDPVQRLITARSCLVTGLGGAPLGYVIVGQDLSRKCKDPDQKELCTVVDHHVGRISTILRRMLNHARPAASECRWVDVSELIHNTLALIRLDQRAAGVTITDTPNPELPMVWLNPQNLEQCLLNIAINALDAMEAKGAGQDHKLDVANTLRDEMVEIRISDTGIGMSPESVAARSSHSLRPRRSAKERGWGSSSATT